jgi:hypothetical protein
LGVFVDPCAGESEVSCEFSGVHEVWRRVRAVVELFSFVV